MKLLSMSRLNSKLNVEDFETLEELLEADFEMLTKDSLNDAVELIDDIGCQIATGASVPTEALLILLNNPKNHTKIVSMILDSLRYEVIDKLEER